ncbi:MAG: hypothetical protein ACREQ4_16525 [Candidatus Binataceae bacterium]
MKRMNQTLIRRLRHMHQDSIYANVLFKIVDQSRRFNRRWAIASLLRKMQGIDPRVGTREGREFLSELESLKVNGPPFVNKTSKTVAFSEMFVEYIHAMLHPGRPRAINGAGQRTSRAA